MKRRRQHLLTCPPRCSGYHSVTLPAEDSPYFWVTINAAERRASLPVGSGTANLTPDKAKRPQLVTESVSAPTTHSDGISGVEIKYSR